MSILPARPPNWRRDTLRQASETLQLAAAGPELAWKDVIQMENLASALQQMEVEEAQVARDPSEMPVVLPGMVVQTLTRRTTFLVLEIQEYVTDSDEQPLQCFVGHNAIRVDSDRVYRVWDGSHHLIWQAPDPSDG